MISCKLGKNLEEKTEKTANREIQKNSSHRFVMFVELHEHFLMFFLFWWRVRACRKRSEVFCLSMHEWAVRDARKIRLGHQPSAVFVPAYSLPRRRATALLAVSFNVLEFSWIDLLKDLFIYAVITAFKALI